MKFLKCYKGKKGIVAVFLLLSLAILTQSVLAITTSGILTQNEIWTGEIIVTGDVVIPEGITLTVLPGTLITFSDDGSDNDVETVVLNELWLGKSNLIVRGDLIIQGKENSRVVIGGLTPEANRPTPVWWGGIIFEGLNVGSLIEYAEIRYADVALVFTGSSLPWIVNSIIANNDVGIMTFDLSSPRIIGNAIERNKLWGISCYDFSFPMISENIIESSEVGIGCEDFSLPGIQYNTFSNNSVNILIQDDSNPTQVGNIFKNNEVRTDIKG